MKKVFVSGLTLFFLFLQLAACAQLHVTFQIIHEPSSHLNDAKFIAGDFNSWSPDDILGKFINNHLVLSLTPGKYDFKITRGDWYTGESDSIGEPLNNRHFTLSSDTTIFISIAGWNDDFNKKEAIPQHTASENVHIIDSAFFMPQLNRYRRLWVYLPPGYKKNEKRYPVLYMHDGQNLFDNATSYSGEWGIDEFLDSINKKNKQEVIVVGIDNGGEFRMSEYNPFAFRNFKAEGKQYVDFLVNTLKPFIDKNYRTLSAKKYTYIAGSSMGGLISLYAIMQYPSVFQAAGIFSPAFWTAPAMDSLVAKDALKVHAKLFFYAGGKESKAMVSDMKRIERIIQKRSSSKVFEKIDPGAHHNEQAWRKYFPLFYQWAIE